MDHKDEIPALARLMQTGRTKRMLSAAKIRASTGAPVIVVAADTKHASTLRARLIGSPFPPYVREYDEMMRSGWTLDWPTGTAHLAGERMAMFVDHATIEHHYRHMLRHLHEFDASEEGSLGQMANHEIEGLLWRRQILSSELTDQQRAFLDEYVRAGLARRIAETQDLNGKRCALRMYYQAPERRTKAERELDQARVEIEALRTQLGAAHQNEFAAIGDLKRGMELMDEALVEIGAYQVERAKLIHGLVKARAAIMAAGRDEPGLRQAVVDISKLLDAAGDEAPVGVQDKPTGGA